MTDVARERFSDKPIPNETADATTFVTSSHTFHHFFVTLAFHWVQRQIVFLATNSSSEVMPRAARADRQSR